ncbi:hypothetical protein F2Q68_00001830 [Brassica cretica]|uniref:Uncharacterized protein n=1 Tax=Brassica cretica TaxID=69181 RepID=A0A8S9JJD9_BRACR|nr:hypothetical protein F2Q68_00001830 [Brassica cretica]
MKISAETSTREEERMMLARFAFRSQLRASVSFRQSASCCSSYSSSSAASAEAERTIREGPRNDWSRDEIKAVYDSPVLDLLFHGVKFPPFSLSRLSL